jgi:uncharacterized membrane protein
MTASEPPPEGTVPPEEPEAAGGREAPVPDRRAAQAAARRTWMAIGVTLFAAGVVFTLTMPDNFVVGIILLGLGVLFFSFSGSSRSQA